jgi:hypothetical protein
LQDAGSEFVHVTVLHAELPAHTDSEQQFVSVPQSLALQGQHSQSIMFGGWTPCVPAGHIAVSPEPIGHEHPGSTFIGSQAPLHAGLPMHEKRSKHPGRPLQL